jgi:general secretion pathway protein I
LKNHIASFRNRRNTNSAGFTLFEVVVALAIAAFGLGLLMAAANTGLDNSVLASQYVAASRRAQSHLDALGVTDPLVPGVRAGDDGGGFTWQTRISPPRVQAASPANGTKGLVLYAVEVSLTWRNGNQLKTFSLQSQRAAPP